MPCGRRSERPCRWCRSATRSPDRRSARSCSTTAPASALVLEHLCELGHRRVAVLDAKPAGDTGASGETMVREAAAALSLEVTTVNSRHSIEAATATARVLLASEPRPTAVFCLSDSIACGVYAAASQAGLSIPGDLSVAGYDDHPIAQVVSPGLTSVEWGMTDVAENAGRLLAAAISGRPRRGARATVIVAPALVRRASTASV